MDDLTRQIVETLSIGGGRPVKESELCRRLKITRPEAVKRLKDCLKHLVETRQVVRSRNGALSLPMRRLVEGTVRKTAAGAGFLVSRRDLVAGASPLPDIFLPPEDLADAQTGDRVLVELRRSNGRDSRPRGRVVEVLERSTRTFVGVYFEREGQGWVQIDGASLSDPILVGDPGARNAQNGDKVVLEMVRFPSQSRLGEGVLTRVLGPRDAAGVDAASIIEEYGLPDEFPDDVLDEARQQAEAFDEMCLDERTDLSALTVVTIDPHDARDFDDAISLDVDDAGHWRLGVHIADVAHFVPAGSALDREARRRGTSVYLPGRVLPMLPEVISNALASLQQDRIRFTRSVLMEFTADGVPVRAEFVRSCIRVTRRFAYEEIVPLIEHDPHSAGIAAVALPVLSLLVRMRDLARLLRQRRLAAGAIELDLPEVKIDLDRQGCVTGAHLVTHDESHQIIEEFMLAANRAVAQELADRQIPFLRRVHEEPDLLRLKSLAEFAKALGYQVKRLQGRRDLQDLLRRVRDTPHRQAINYALLRSLKQARYSPDDLGHYALAAEHYCHFTSPIRRYPDLLVHRLLDGLMTARRRHAAGPGPDELQVAGEHCSRTERRAEQAERELIKIKLLTYLSGKIGQNFSAVITGVAEYGFFCLLEEIPAEGLVHLSTLDDDLYDFDRAAQAIVGRRSGRRHQLGEAVEVVVARVDVDRRQLDLRLAGSRSARQVAGRLSPGAGKTRGVRGLRSAAGSAESRQSRRGSRSEGATEGNPGKSGRQLRSRRGRRRKK